MDETHGAMHADAIMKVYERSLSLSTKFTKLEADDPDLWHLIGKLNVYGAAVQEITHSEILATIIELHDKGELILIQNNIDKILYEFHDLIRMDSRASGIILCGKSVFAEYVSNSGRTERNRMTCDISSLWSIGSMITDHLSRDVYCMIDKK